jgi:hypothetical protein
VNAPQNDKSNCSLAYADFVSSLVKAVQELSKLNDELKNQNNELEQRLAKLETMMKLKQIFARIPLVISFYVSHEGVYVLPYFQFLDLGLRFLCPR